MRDVVEEKREQSGTQKGEERKKAKENAPWLTGIRAESRRVVEYFTIPWS